MMPLSLYYFLAIAAVNVLMGWALYLPYRLAQLHFLTVAVMAFSGYLSGYLVTSLGAPFGPAFAAGVLAGAIAGFLVSTFVGDAPTFAVVIVGLAFIFIVRTAIENTPAVGGALGMFGLPDIGGNPATHRRVILSILCALVLIVGFLLWRFEHSGLGRAASVVFADRQLAASLGIKAKRLGALLQTFSCALAGACGVLYGFTYKGFNPEFFSFTLLGEYLTVLFVGGFATPWGPLVAAPLLYGLPLFFPPQIASLRLVIYGALLVLVLVFRPQGLVTRRFVQGIESFLRAKSGARR
jgi:branched-chain amino acid transport system permease protein